ncbi:DUF202 domain-containing protein [Nocardia sp. NBC_00403]|uniref:DUF202 domain-containing protein n=1 Tax=Nocardia sp. NBC_00403 TaxID=2975990 RepID=UPI002E212F55
MRSSVTGDSARGAVNAPGLQPERTILAWQRTLLAATVACAGCARAATGRPSASLTAATLVLSAVLVVITIGTRLRRRRYRRRADDPRPIPQTVGALLCAGIGAAAGCVLLSLL